MSGSRLSKITISWFSPNFHIFICHEKTIRAMHFIFAADLQLYGGEFLEKPRLYISIRTTGTDINVFRSVWYPVIGSMRTHPNTTDLDFVHLKVLVKLIWSKSEPTCRPISKILGDLKKKWPICVFYYLWETNLFNAYII